MYLEKITLRNFKCFVGQELPLSKITLLLGANSAGKSSVLYGILAALQSDQFPLELSANGELVNLGDFRALALGHRSETSVSVGLDFGAHALGKVSLAGSFTRSAKSDAPLLESADITDPSLTVRVSRTDRYKAEWTYDSKSDPLRKQFLNTKGAREFFQALNRLMKQVEKASKKKRQKHDNSDLFDEPPPDGSFTFSRASEFFQRFAQPRYMVLGSHLAALSSTLSTFRRTFNYIGSFRLEPQRSYYQTSKGDLKVLRDGSNCIEQIAEWQEQDSPKLEQLRRALRSLGLLSGVKASRLKSGLFEIRVLPHRGTTSMSLADVGFGVGQFLPILVADLQLPKNSTLTMSQPEIHLHPSVQADFADFMVRRMKTNNLRYVVETHSEYLINRFRLLVAKGDLSPSDLSIIYLTNNGKHSSSHFIKFLPDGQIDGAPKDFFQTYMIDVMKLALAAAPA